MEKIVKERKDIAFYLKMYPLTQLHPDAYAKSKAVVCEKDNKKAIRLLEDIYAKKPVKLNQCETDAVDRNIKLAEKLGISGTPAIIFQNGMRVSGALEEAELIQAIERNSGK